jgi:hypothetical protein
MIAIGVVVFGYVAGRWLYQKDTEMEKRRRAAFRISSQLRSQGLTVVPDFLEDYAVGDYSTMAHKLQEAAVVLFNDSALNAEFENVWQTLLQGKLNDPAELQKLFDLVKSKVQADPVLNIAAAPAPAVTTAAPAASDGVFTAQHVADIVSQAVQSAVAAVKTVAPAVQAVEQVAAAAAKVA